MLPDAESGLVLAAGAFRSAQSRLYRQSTLCGPHRQRKLGKGGRKQRFLRQFRVLIILAETGNDSIINLVRPTYRLALTRLMVGSIPTSLFISRTNTLRIKAQRRANLH